MNCPDKLEPEDELIHSTLIHDGTYIVNGLQITADDHHKAIEAYKKLIAKEIKDAQL